MDKLHSGVFLDRVRAEKPLIHCITNYVTANDVANMLLACGASPIMADDPADAHDIASLCRGLVLNIGTLNERKLSAIRIAGKTAKDGGKKVLLDPVGAGASHFRTEAALEIMETIKPDIVRGNISEIRALAKGIEATKGVDASEADAVQEDTLDSAVRFIKRFALHSGTIVAASGKIDLVTDGTVCCVIRNGREEMRTITGTGCQLSGLMTAFLSVSPEAGWKAVAAADIAMGLAGEIAWTYKRPEEGNATCRNRIIDAIWNMTGDALEKGANYDIR